MQKFSEKKTSKRKSWHYQPSLPVQSSPLFTKPFKLKAIIQWYIQSWLPMSERMIILLLSIISWSFFHPSLEHTQQFQADWISQIFLRNLCLLLIVAGGLHLYLYTFNAQGDKRQFDIRPLGKNKRIFTFNNQLIDNIFWSCCSGVTIWTFYEVIMMWAMANEYIPVLPESGYLLWSIVIIFLIPIWETFYFYIIHRSLHWPPLYRFAHSLHHRNTNVGPWSGLSMHPFEHLIYLGSVLIHFVIPSNPLLIIFHLQYFTLSAVTTHSGHEALTSGDKNYLPLGTFHHQLHHRYFDCNYGGLEIPWDKWFDSFHDGSEKSHTQFLNKRKKR
jgi:sterol desaturase/sphingolipid hydroxylase (fatty acid hydroxylase superfamily)